MNVPPPPPVPPAAPPAQPAQPGPPAVAFALVPGDFNGIIDYSTRQGLAIYSQATRSLFEDTADLFNVESAGLQTFLALLRHRGTTCGWDFDIPINLANPLQDLLDLTTNHGRFTLEHLRNFSATFVNNQSRAAQMNIQMVTCILASLTLPGFRKIQTWHVDWHIGDRPSALALIKIIIRESFIDTQATTRILRAHLSSLPDKLEQFKGDIDQLNAFVKVTQDQLSAHGETTHDLLANLFKGCLSSKDPTFCRCIKKQQEDHDDGTGFTVDSLMTLASNKFKTLVEAGKWMALTDEQSKIIALEAKLGRLNNRSSNQPSSNRGRNNSGSSSRNSSSNSSTGNNNRNRQGRNQDIPAWMKKWPGKAFVEANKTKVRDGKEHWWCKKHKRFCRHQTSDCKLASSSPASATAPAANPRATPVTSNRESNNNLVPTIRVTSATLMDE
jgi:hypothetical protein